MTKVKKRIIAGSLAAVVCAGIAFAVVAPAFEKTETADVPHYDQIVITPNESYGVELMSATIDPVEYETYGISEQAESAQSVTAVMTPEGSFTFFDWSVAWSDSTDEFASGKTVTDYISVAATSDGANTATVTCYGEFGTQIVLTAQSRTNSSLKATATIDYEVRFKGVGFELLFDDTAKSAVGVTDIDMLDSYESANITMPAPNKITESGSFNYSIVTSHSDFTTRTSAPMSSTYYGLYVKCSDSFAAQLTAQGLSAATNYMSLGISNGVGSFIEGTYSGMQGSSLYNNILGERFAFTSKSAGTNQTYYVSLARLYGALSEEVMTTDGTAFTDSLVGFVNAAKATSGYHFEITVKMYYGASSEISTTYYVTFDEDTLQAVEPTSVGFEDTSLWF